jgi:hypothetical protein
MQEPDGTVVTVACVLDGQHRVRAVVDAGIATPMLITYFFGLSDSTKARAAIDNVRPRSVADRGVLSGRLPEENTNQVVATINCVAAARKLDLQGVRGRDVNDIEAELAKPVGSAVQEVVELSAGTRQLTSPLRAAFAISLLRDREKTVDALKEVINAFRGNPSTAFGSRIAKEHSDHRLLATNHLLRLQATARVLWFLDIYLQGGADPYPVKVFASEMKDMRRVLGKFGSF